MDRRSPADLALEPDLAVQDLDKLSDEREADPYALAFLGLVVLLQRRIELALLLRRHPAAKVYHRDAQEPAVGPRAHADGGALLGIAEGIVDQLLGEGRKVR